MKTGEKAQSILHIKFGRENYGKSITINLFFTPDLPIAALFVK